MVEDGSVEACVVSVELSVTLVIVEGEASVDTYNFRFGSEHGSTRLLLDNLHSPVIVLNDTP